MSGSGMRSAAYGLLPTDTTEDVRTRGAGVSTQVAVLPVGSFEQHGPYLPLATDTLVACAVAREIAAAYPVHLLPPVTISCSHEHAAWPGTVSISSVTLHAVVCDIAQSLRRSGRSRSLCARAVFCRFSARILRRWLRILLRENTGPCLAI